MADLLDFTIARNGTVNLPNAPTWKFEGRVVDSADQSVVLQDMTGANAVNFPQVLGQLTQAQQDEFVRRSVQLLLHFKFGV